MWNVHQDAPHLYYVGDTTPRISFLIEEIESDPTGATATYRMIGWYTAGTPVTGAATVGEIASYTNREGETRWRMRVSAAPVTTTAGRFAFKFIVTVGGSIATVPASWAPITVRPVV